MNVQIICKLVLALAFIGSGIYLLLHGFHNSGVCALIVGALIALNI